VLRVGDRPEPGVPTALIQLAAASGVHVWVTGRTPDKRDLARSLGAARTFASNAVLPGHVDAVFDCVGEATWSHSVHAVRDGGRIITCAATTGDAPSAGLRHLIRHQIDVRGTYAGSLEELRRLIAFVVSSGLTPRIGGAALSPRRFPAGLPQTMINLVRCVFRRRPPHAETDDCHDGGGAGGRCVAGPRGARRHRARR
jgi:hypothetical protein